jgi:large subunit ribosomal protein L21
VSYHRHSLFEQDLVSSSIGWTVYGRNYRKHEADGGVLTITIEAALPCTCNSMVSKKNALLEQTRFQSTSAVSTCTSSSTSSSAIPASQLKSNSINNKKNSTTQSLRPSKTPPATNDVHSTTSALSLLRSQPSHYIIASIYRRRFLLTPRDIVTVPKLKDVQVGDVIQLDNIHEVGSRDYTLRSTEGEVLSKESVRVNATVVEHTKGKMEATVKFKKRKGYTKTIKNKSKYTRLVVGEIEVGGGGI